MHNQIRQFGFTIIELLVVVVIIGILAAIVVVSYNGITRNARDVAVQVDIRAFQKVVEFYKDDNGTYPTTAQIRDEGGVKIDKELYNDTGQNNMYYCVAEDGDNFAIGATAEKMVNNIRPGFRYNSITDKIEPLANVTQSAVCPGSEGYGASNSQTNYPSCAWSSGTCYWYSWIK